LIMTEKTQQIAIIGGNKQGIGLLPTLLQDSRVEVACIIDPNPNAMIFKLEEMGYRLAEKYRIRISNDLNNLKDFTKLDFIVNCLDEPYVNNFLRQPEFVNIELLTPLSVRLLWSLRGGDTPPGSKTATDQFALLSTMREVVDAVRLTTDKKELLTVILILAIEATRAERGSLMLIDESDGTLRVEVARGMDIEVARKIRIPIGEGIAGRVAKDKKPILITGKASAKEFTRLRDRRDVKSALSVPLIVDGKIIGVINASSSESTHAFTEEDLNFLVSLVNLAAEVIHRSDELGKMKGADAKFSLWKKINSLMSSVDSLDKRLNKICSTIAEYIEGVTSYIYLYSEEDAALVMKSSSVKSTARIGNLTLQRGEGLEGWVADTKKSVILVDREVELGLNKMYLGLPMVAEGKFIGVLSVHLITREEPASYIEPLLTELATFLADNISRSKKHEESILRSTRIFAVDETGLELLSITDPNRFYHTVATTLAAIIGAEGSTIRTRYNGSSKFKLRGAFGLEDHKIREYFLPIEREVLMETLGSNDMIRKEIGKDESGYIRSVLAHPLSIEHKVIDGVVTLFNKNSEGSIYAHNFSRADTEVLKRFVAYIQKGMKMLASSDARAREYEFLTTREYFERRASEEISRGKRFGRRFLLLTLRIPGLTILSKYEGERIVQDILSFVRERIRDFDIVAKLDEERLAILFLESDEKALRVMEDILRSVDSENIFSKMNLGREGELGYGYAIFPEDGATIKEILKKAFERSHIHMVSDESRMV
jgi:GAF domain-containing protein/GGDEF domain-containing protein